VIVIIPHTPIHDVRTPLYKSFGYRIEDVIIIYDKVILTQADYVLLKKKAKEILSNLNDQDVGLLLTGSYAACVIVYRVMIELGLKPRLLQYDPHMRRYFEVTA